MSSTAEKKKDDVVKRNPSPHRIQNGLLQRNVGHLVSCLLNSGNKISGKLLDYDTYTLLLEIPDTGEEILIFKHHIEIVRTKKNKAKENSNKTKK
ncbi:RNA chaperone Hfq [Bacillus sp. FJAT-47783]|uniref:RNA chaperone Hfq n=1 Tax=Bacillus sp. FJAT-47783 TaxID=2922712 RepID=UPI001FAD439B|nr:RNA chaperone Hfq [Bacillus sp. FJAT-47783]